MMSGQTLTGLILMLISLGMLVHGLFYYEPLTLAETQVRAGVLASDPKFDETSGDTHKEYIEVQFVGSDEKYRFIDCSHMNFVVENMELVSKGDSLVLRVEDNRYARVAWSPKLYTILSHKSYNDCTHWQAKQWTPKVWGGALIISLVIIVNSFIQSLGNDRFMDIPANEVADIRLPLEFRGDFWTFIISNSATPLIALGLGINNLIRADSSDRPVGYFLTIVGIGWAIQLIRSGIAKI
jgi:hypothetical protein